VPVVVARRVSGHGPRRCGTRISEKAFLIEEFLIREHGAGAVAVGARGPCRKLARCCTVTVTRKAFDALGAVQQLLGLIPGLAVEVIESIAAGCRQLRLWTRRTTTVSMRMAELSLLPAARAASSDTLLVADGTIAGTRSPMGTYHTDRAQRFMHPRGRTSTEKRRSAALTAGFEVAVAGSVCSSALRSSRRHSLRPHKLLSRYRVGAGATILCVRTATFVALGCSHPA
jgi:hypothetical protein